MSARDDLFKQFGPFLTETLLWLLLEQINLLRINQGMPEITEADLIATASNHITELEPYEWQIEE